MCRECHENLGDEFILADLENFYNQIVKDTLVIAKINSTSINHLLLAYSGLNGQEVRNMADKILGVICENVPENVSSTIRTIMSKIDGKFFTYSQSEIRQKIYGEHIAEPHISKSETETRLTESDDRQTRLTEWDEVVSEDDYDILVEYFDSNLFNDNDSADCISPFNIKTCLLVAFGLMFVYVCGHSLGYL